MPIGRRLTGMFRASRAAAPAAPDPVALLEQGVHRQEAAVDRARRSLADLAVHRRRAELLADRAYAEAADLERRARAALGAGAEDDARALLARSVTARSRAREQAERCAALDGQIQRLDLDLQRLESAVEAARHRFSGLRADRDAARVVLDARDELRASGLAAVQAEGAAAEAAREVRRLRAHALAREELAWTDPSSPRVGEAFDALLRERAAAEELARLQERLGLPGGGDRD